jgi:hypothetical protein
MNIQIANFASDLRRISYFIYQNRNKLAKKFLTKSRKKYANIPREIGCYKNIWEEIGKIERLEGGKDKAAERASTASIILLNNSKITY